MKKFMLGLFATLLLFMIGCDDDNAVGTDEPDGTTLVITGGGPVLQILPGPAVFAQEAAPIISMFPPPAQNSFNLNAANGPFSNNVAEISGDFSMTVLDAGLDGDTVEGSATFTAQDGATWRMEFVRVNPNGMPPIAPFFGGVATDFVFHGTTALHTPLMPTVRAEATMWGFAEVFRNGELLNDNAPFHMMLTTASRGDDFTYMCYTCTTNEIRQVHLVSRSPGGARDALYDKQIAPGGFLHLTWEQSTFVRTDS